MISGFNQMGYRYVCDTYEFTDHFNNIRILSSYVLICEIISNTIANYIFHIIRLHATLFLSVSSILISQRSFLFISHFCLHFPLQVLRSLCQSLAGSPRQVRGIISVCQLLCVYCQGCDARAAVDGFVHRGSIIQAVE